LAEKSNIAENSGKYKHGNCKQNENLTFAAVVFIAHKITEAFLFVQKKPALL